MTQIDTQAAADTAAAVVQLGGLALAFGRVDRITYHPDGVTPESDTDHTVMLGLLACSLAQKWFPGLNVGRVAQYALVHDLVEVYAGDTNTLRALDAIGRADKHARESAAAMRLDVEFRDTLPWLSWTLLTYEDLATPEARFVKMLDKLMPKITHILNGAATIRQQGMSRGELVGPRGSNLSMPGYLEAYRARLAPCLDRLAQVSLECRPALELIAEYGRHDEALLYVDPPYLGSVRNWGNQYRHELRTDQEHEDLARALLAARAAVVISGYPSALYDELYAGWDRVQLAARTTQGQGGGERTEVLWSNRPLGLHLSLFDLEGVDTRA